MYTKIALESESSEHMDYLIPAIELGVIGLILLALFVPARKKKGSESPPSVTKEPQADD